MCTRFWAGANARLKSFSLVHDRASESWRPFG
jgi:hypothetical protein